MTRRLAPAAAQAPTGAPSAVPSVPLLLQRLARPGEPSAATLELAQRLFDSVGDPLRVRWLECELRGYGHSGAVSLRDSLGLSQPPPGSADVPDGDSDAHPLVARVRGYRQYTGRVRSAAASRLGRAAPLQVPYFFGESIDTVHHLRANADAIGLEYLEIEVVATGRAGLSSLPSGAPARTLEFPRNVFYRILAGLTVELELALHAVPGALA